MRRSFAVSLSAILALSACLDSGPEPVEFQVIEDATFAPALNVDLERMTVTAEGIYYEDLEAGDGAVAEVGSAVVVDYVLWLTNGVQIDSGRLDPSVFGAPFVLGSGQVVPGFDLGIRGMRVGGSRLVLVPPALGYGGNPNGPIPPGSILVFRIDLVSAE